MLFEDLKDSARTLLSGRGRALGSGLAQLAREYANFSSQELADAITRVPRDQKVGVGLLLARVALEEAVTTRSRELFARFLYRFGSHLKVSVSDPGLAPGQRLAIATAAEILFDALPTSSSAQRAEAASIRARLSGSTASEADWRSTLGVTHSEFVLAMDRFRRELGDRRRSAPRERPRAPKRLPKRPAAPKIPTHAVPSWLSLSFPSPPEPLVCATANWEVTNATHSEVAHSLTLAWSAFVEHKYHVARSALDELLAKLGTEWGPTSSADSLRSWNWVRLVVELAAIEDNEVSDVRRSWTSVCTFAQRSIPDDTDRIDEYVSRALADFIASDMATKRAWSAYAARLVVELGPDVALAIYSNHEKAALRAVWAERFSLSPTDVRSTAAAVATIAPQFEQPTRSLYLGARQASRPARVLRDASHSLAHLLDEAEGVILTDSLEVVEEADRLGSAEGATLRDLRDLVDDLGNSRERIARSGSALLQDFVAPILEVATAVLEEQALKLGDTSRPEIEVQLSSAKLPFSAIVGSPYDIGLILTNTGNTPAEGITLRLTQSDLSIDSRGTLSSLGPGAQAELSVKSIASGHATKAVSLHCEVQWTDALLQQFSARFDLAAEDQMQAAWTETDVNPFSLGTISEPARLVGRAGDLASLDALIAGNASAYVTGHKRVGKTSLVKVLLRSAIDSRGWASSMLPLGRALGQEQSAGDIVYALLDEIMDAARTKYGQYVQSLPDVVVDDTGNFARAANRWLRLISRALPADARIVVAIDDFDELPQHLIVGPQADALFLFLRSLVDEPWLNLIVVGSEILPSIIQAQAHKLNQVVPVSVTNFSSRSSTAELLETPTRDRLEWLTDAIDRLHYLCAGNPYYETLVAQRLWQSMRERSRSVVAANDINEAAVAIARDAPDSHFIHLWADSASGLDHTARSAIVSSAVLRSVARAGGENLAAVARDEVTRLAQSWIQTATTEELLLSIAALRSREVLRASQSGDKVYIAIPLVGIWLQSAGARALDGVYANSKHAIATVRMITDADLVELARNLQYRGEQVTEIRVKAWLEQFGGNDRQYLAYKMLRRMLLDGYFTPTRLQRTEIPRLVKSINESNAARIMLRDPKGQYYRNAYLVNHGVPGDSTQGTLSLVAKALKITKSNIVKASEIADRIRPSHSDVVLLLLDDYCGTGTHLSRELDSLVQKITELGEDWVERVHVVVGASVVADEADLPISAGPISVEAVAGRVLGERFRPFSEESGLFDTAKEREDALEMTMSIGNALLPNNPLGFGGKALLTLFEFNCPNNVAPIFWKSGIVSGVKWHPLFERAI